MRKSILLAATAMTAMATPVMAQENDDDSNIIIVTAQRQAQSLQDVPIAVSAFDSAALEEQQIDNTSDLQLSLPNTTFTKGNFTGANFSIRGIGSAVVASSGDAGVGVHFNDMPIVGPRLFETEFYDLERLEVLRGPQGTLFGRNATGGVINLITARPESEFGASGEISYGSYNALMAKGMVNIPAGDIAAFRLAGVYQKRDGYTENVFTGNDIDGRDSYSIRGSLKLTPSDRTTISVVGQYFKEDSNRSRNQKQLCVTDPTGILGCNPSRLGNESINGDATLATIITSSEFMTIVGAGALAPFAMNSVYADDGQSFSNAVNPADPRKVSLDYEPVYKSNELIIQAELEHEFDGLTITLNGGYVDNGVSSQTDYNSAVTDSIVNNAGLVALRAAAAGGNPVAGAWVNSGLFNGNQICVSQADPNDAGFANGLVQTCADNTTEFDQSSNDYKAWSVEGRLASDLDGPFNFMLGGMYLSRKGDTDYYVNTSGLDYGALILGGGAGINLSPFFNSRTDQNNLKSWGVFGEAYLKASDSLQFTLGLRYSNDKKFVRDRSALYAGAIAPFGGVADGDALILAAAQAGARDADPSTPCDAATGAGCDDYREQSAKFNELTGRFVVDWKPVLGFTDDSLFYASVSRGYKPGGINPPIDPSLFEAPDTFKSEIINAVEFGTKNTFGGGTLQLNMTAFYYDYKDLQVSRIVNRTSFNDNTPAETYGLELEAIVRPAPNFTVNTSLSYLKTKIKDLQLVNTRDPSAGRDDVVIIKDITNASNCAVIPTAQGSTPIANTRALVDGFNTAATGGLLRSAVPVPGTNAYGAYSICGALAGFLDATVPGAYVIDRTPLDAPVLPAGVPVDLSGNQLLNSPNWKFSVGAQYDIETSSGWTITPRADVHMTGNSFGTNFNVPVDKLKGFVIANAQLTVKGPDDRFFIQGSVQNLFDDNAVTGQYVTDPSSGLFTNIFTLDPRRFTISAGFKF